MDRNWIHKYIFEDNVIACGSLVIKVIVSGEEIDCIAWNIVIC